MTAVYDLHVLLIFCRVRQKSALVLAAGKAVSLLSVSAAHVNPLINHQSLHQLSRYY